MADDKRDQPVNRMRDVWMSESPPERVRLEVLRAEARRRRRRMGLVVLLEIVLTGVLIAVTVSIVLDAGATGGRMAWLGAVWLTWLAVAGFATWNRWGVWSPQAETARSYLMLAAERARRRRRAALFVFALTAVQAAALFATRDGITVAGIAIVLLYAAWAVWYGIAAQRDLTRFRGLSAQLREDTAGL